MTSQMSLFFTSVYLQYNTVYVEELKYYVFHSQYKVLADSDMQEAKRIKEEWHGAN